MIVVEVGAQDKVMLTHQGSTCKVLVYVNEFGELAVTLK